MRWPLLFLGWIILSVQLKSNPDSLSAVQLFHKALQYEEQNQWENAIQNARQALNLLDANNPSSTLWHIRIYSLMGDCAIELGDNNTALTNYQQAKKKADARGITDTLTADIQNKLGNYYLEVKEYEQALPRLENALELRVNALGKTHMKVADVYNNLGLCQLNLGDFDKAIEFQEQALRIRASNLEAPHPKLAQSQNNLGLSLQSKNRGKEALEQFLISIEQYQALGPSFRSNLADVYINLASLYFYNELPAQSIDYNTKALKIYQQIRSPGHPLLGLCYNNLGNAYIAQEQYNQAFHYYQEALQNRINHFGPVHPDVAETYYNMGLANFYQGQLKETLNSMQSCARGLNYHPDQELGISTVNDYQILLPMLRVVAEVKILLYSETNLTNHLTEALDDFVQLDILLDYLRIRYESLGSKMDLQAVAHAIYERAIQLNLLLHDLSEEKKYWHKAFYYCEKSKGMILFEATQKAKAVSFANIPDQVIHEIKELETSITRLEKRIFLEQENSIPTNSEFLDSIQNRLFNQKLSYSRKIKETEINYPAYYNLRYASNIATVGTVQNKIGPNLSIVSYFMGDNHLQIFLINEDDFKTINVPIPIDFTIRLDSFQTNIRQFPFIATKDIEDNLEQFTENAYYLYQFLILPIEEFLHDQVMIIPDVELGYLPFEALLSEVPENVAQIKKYNYLINDLIISYNYSVNLWLEIQEDHRRNKLKNYLGFAPHFMHENHLGLAALAYNESEIRTSKKKINGKVFLAEKATKDLFLERQHNYKIVHLATHGMANNQAENYSFLAFSQDQEDISTALLYTSEIYNLQSNADLVILSACETSTGKLLKGEGIASIARSFTYAGSKCILATRWNINDKTTAQLMDYYLDHIQDNIRKDASLHRAVKTYISNSTHAYAHPFYWASFMSIGNMDSITLSPNYFSKYATILVFVILAGFIIRKRINPNNI